MGGHTQTGVRGIIKGTLECCVQHWVFYGEMNAVLSDSEVYCIHFQTMRQAEGLPPLCQEKLDEARNAIDCFRPAKKLLPIHLQRATAATRPLTLPPLPATTAQQVGWLTSSPKHNLEIYGMYPPCGRGPKGSLLKQFGWTLDNIH